MGDLKRSGRTVGYSPSTRVSTQDSGPCDGPLPVVQAARGPGGPEVVEVRPVVVDGRRLGSYFLSRFPLEGLRFSGTTLYLLVAPTSRVGKVRHTVCYHVGPESRRV